VRISRAEARPRRARPFQASTRSRREPATRAIWRSVFEVSLERPSCWSWKTDEIELVSSICDEARS